MRLGGRLFQNTPDPDSWIRALKVEGYRAAYCPVDESADNDTVQSYAEAASKADIVIAEVGAFGNNPIGPEPQERKASLEKLKSRLDLADRIGAHCCVNVSGSRGDVWDGPHPSNLTEETFQLVVDSVRQIIDAVAPRRSFFTLETMPWMFPDSPDSYLDLIRAVDRSAFAVHFDPANLIKDISLYFRNGTYIKECVAKLGPHIKSCHIKDIRLRSDMTVHIEEVIPGTGDLALPTLLNELGNLDVELPIMLEHLDTQEHYRQAAAHVRMTADNIGAVV